jgi:cytochrome c553
LISNITPAHADPKGIKYTGIGSCTGCHAAKRIPDSVIPRIAGRKADDIAKFMREYRSGAWPSSVMGRIAKGFDDSQIDAIAAWFAKQPE